MKIIFKENRRDNRCILDLLNKDQNIKEEFEKNKINPHDWHISCSFGSCVPFEDYHYLPWVSFNELKKAINMMPLEIIESYLNDVKCHMISSICKAYLGKFDNLRQVECITTFLYSDKAEYFCYYDYSKFVHVFDSKKAIGVN